MYCVLNVVSHRLVKGASHVSPAGLALKIYFLAILSAFLENLSVFIKEKKKIVLNVQITNN